MLVQKVSGKFLACVVVLSLIFTAPSLIACDTSPVLSGSNVQNVGGGNYTVDIQVCSGVNGSTDGFDLSMGCGLGIVATSAAVLTSGANTATPSIAGGTITYTCAGCNASNWFAADDGIAGPCWNFTLTVNGNPENCPFTVTGVNDGCLIIATSWSATIPGPCITSASFTAPGSQPGNTASSGNTCNLRSSNDQIIEVNLPCADIWTFSLCGSASWDTYLYLGTSCCSSNMGQNDDACGLQSSITAPAGPGLVYVTVEAFSSGSGAYTLAVTGGNGCPLEFEGLEIQAIPNLSSNAIEILWTVENEESVDYYFLERSEDGGSYVSVEQMEPLNNLNGPSSYAILDQFVKEDVAYSYRLHVHTKSGLTYDTEVVTVILTGTEGFQAGRFYPNPASESISLDVQSNFEGQVSATIFDVTGRIVDVRNVAVHAGSSPVNFDISALGSGTYFVRLLSKDNVALMRKFAVQ